MHRAGQAASELQSAQPSKGLARRQPSARPLRLVAASTAGLGLTGALPSIALGLETGGCARDRSPPTLHSQPGRGHWELEAL